MIGRICGFAESSAASKAAAYFLACEESLMKYMEDGRCPIDNNR
ncbi:MAG: transposase, partial [Erysipelotrichaceae bacterium]|nr:transposase [Erysipelotrichaceae bacterium]